MDASEVRNRIKKIIGSIAGIDPQRIGDEATLRGELSLDSLSLLEIGVDVDLAFQLNLPDESYKEIDSLPAMVELVMRRQAELTVVPADPGAATIPGSLGSPDAGTGAGARDAGGAERPAGNERHARQASAR
jgi:acyl carrier protein